MFIPDPDPDFFHIPNPGSRGQKSTGSRIQNTAKNNINRGPQQEAKSDWGEWEAADLGETVGDVDGARAQLVTQHAHHIPRCNLVRQVLSGGYKEMSSIFADQ
jgi:hypothetical protein